MLVIMNNNIYTITILAPVGRFKKKDTNNPNIKHIIDTVQESIINPLKLFVNFFDIIAGKIIKLDINKVPIILIPNTATKPVTTDINIW